jgi:AraC family transcriptional regulator, alkane utilization regulator
MDALSDVLKTVRLDGAVYKDAEFTAPWCIRARHGLDAVRDRLPGAEAVLFFHFVAEGACRVRVGNREEIAAPGDLIVFLQDERQLMGSDLGLAPTEVEPMVPPSVASTRFGGGGERTRLVCGYMGYSRSLCRPLFEVLPRALRIPMGDGPAARLLRELLQTGVRESADSRPGGGSLLAKLAELMFVEALRRYVDALPARKQGWLTGLRDPHVGRALGLVHGEPDKSWTVDDLAREVAMSRSAFAERFSSLVGEPPMQYLMRWRLALAAQELRSGSEAITRVAQRSGYDSDAAFSRAFKREFGMPPAAWRKAAAK